jgi:hypothetical protein
MDRESWNRQLRYTVAERDRLVGDSPTLSPARRARLTSVLREQFPLDSALRKAGTERDRMLANSTKEISRAIARDLRLSLKNARNERVDFWRSMGARAALLAASLAVLVVAHEFLPSSLPVRSREAVGESLPRAQFVLRMNAVQLASLPETLLTSNRNLLVESADASSRFRLDLPVRVLLRDDDFSSFP